MLVSCNPLTIKSDSDPGTDFSQYKTYYWAKVRNGNLKPKSQRNPFLLKRIKKMIDETLAQRGLQVTENKKDADLLLALYFDNKNQVNVSYVGYGYGPWYYGGPVVSEYKEGTMVIDLADAKKKELVWRGVASGIAHKDDYTEEDIKYIVTRILKQYPPGS
jgi:hypothetical protein